MNKKILILLLVLLFPTMVKADPSGYIAYDMTFEAYVNDKEGIVVYPDNCYEEEDGKYYDRYSFDYDKYDSEYGTPSCPDDLPDINDIYIDEYGTYYYEEGGNILNKDCYENNGYPSWVKDKLEECKPEVIIPYKAVVKVTYVEDDGDGTYYTFTYKGKEYYADAESLIGTSVNLNDYNKYKVNTNLIVLGDITLYNGPDPVFEESNDTLKYGDKVSVKYVLPNGYYYVENSVTKGWINESDLIDEDGIYGYFEENGTKRVYKKKDFKAYDTSKRSVQVPEEVTDFYTINYIGYVRISDIYEDDEEYYAYKDKAGNLIFIDYTCLGDTPYYYYNDPDTSYLQKSYMYITDNTDVKMIRFDKPNEAVDTSKILKNNEVYYIVEQYNNYYYIAVDNIGYVIILEYESDEFKDKMELTQKATNYGATLIDLSNHDMLLLSKNAPYYLSPTGSLKQLGLLNKGEYIIPIDAHYNRLSKEYFLNVLGYGWINLSEDMFEPLSEKEYYEEVDYEYEYNLRDQCNAYKEGKSEKEYRYDSYFNPEVCYNPKKANSKEELSIYDDYFGYDEDEDYTPEYLVLDYVSDKSLIQKLYPLYDPILYGQYKETQLVKDYKNKLNKVNANNIDYKIPGDVKADTPTVSEIIKNFEMTTKKVEKNDKPTVAKEAEKNEKDDYTLPLIVAVIVAVVVSLCITIMILIKNKKNKTPVVEEEKVTPVEETPKEETPAEESTEPKNEETTEPTTTEEPKVEEAEKVEEEPKEESEPTEVKEDE